jgi:hypothetical protein
VSERLDDLFNALGEAADGKRHLPVIQPGDASLVIGLFHSQIDRATEARTARVEASGHTVACQLGCNHCCTNVVIVFDGEAVAIAEWLRLPEHAEALAAFQARYPAWKKQLERDLEAWDAAMSTGNAGAAERVLVQAWKEQAMCAFNVDGKCSVYDVRPAVCRNAHALDTPDHCLPGTSENLTTFQFAPLDEYLTKIQPIMLALHAALRPDRVPPRPVCLAVHEELAKPR